ncbi:MAG: hypothetical protein JSU96_02040 [Acidobacteriota bacterium]|nr:MAG: hypothetical protein JSU96_02040 [Acidobacteriota bacterium]
MKGMQLTAIIAVSVVLSISLPTELIGAKKYSGKGKSLITPHSREEHTLPDGRILRYARNQGFTLSDDPDHPQNMASVDCSNILLLEPDGQKWSGSGTCISIDRDGDMSWSWWEGTQEGVKWEYLKGTGKYDGVKGSGTSTLDIHNFPNGKWIEEWESTLELK